MKHDLPDISLFRHRCPVQIRFNDIDILGHLNNTVYFSFYDTGKAHYFQDVRRGTMNWRKVDTVIANVNNAYIAPIFFGENISVYSRCVEIHEKSFQLEQLLVNEDTKEVKSFCRTVMVGFDGATGKSQPIPEVWVKQFCEYEGRDLVVRKTT